MSIKILKNCRIFDGRNEALVEGGSIVIEKDVIREIRRGKRTSLVRRTSTWAVASSCPG